jgi:hypothetical protein
MDIVISNTAKNLFHLQISKNNRWMKDLLQSIEIRSGI